MLGKDSNFSLRKSPINVKVFLESLLANNAYHSASLSQHCLGLVEDGHKKVSKQAFDKRLNSKAKTMLEMVLKKILSSQMSLKMHIKGIESLFSDIRIMDSSEFKVGKRAATSFPGYGGVGREAIVQIQFEYQLLSKKVNHISIGSALDSDYNEGLKTLVDVQPNTLLLRDLAYVGKEYFQLLKSKNLYYISRGKTQWSYYIKEEGKYERLSTLAIIEKLKSQKAKYIDIEVFVGSEKHKEPMRLIANLLTETQKKKRLKKKIANRGKLGNDAIEGTELNLFLTNVEKDKCDAEGIFSLYSLRWQIELVFKTWKTVLRIDEIHSMNAIRLECVILIKLIWIMLNWTILKMLQSCIEQEISFHKLSQALINKSQRLTIVIMENKDLLSDWLIKLFNSMDYCMKENKKGRRSSQEIISLMYS